ncbi:MAG: ParB/RepB/Spo0J family partition protein [Pseudonocardiaceae bacterium]
MHDDVYPVASWRRPQQGNCPVVTVTISSLRSSDSPRLEGESTDHVRALAESEVPLPPIIVDRSTMRVIDGMHRLRAAVLRGQDEIRVQFFEGDEGDAFVLAVEANVRHGLPLSLTDRTAAAARIIRSHPELSDRAIASVTGLAAKTVRAIGRCSTAANPQLNTRVGRDGRIRPLDAAKGRRIAADLMTEQPNSSLRQIANAAGISLGTAQNVRERLRRGEDPLPPRRHEGKQLEGQAKPEIAPSGRGNRMVARARVDERHLILKKLLMDPSLRFTEAGRVLIRLLHPLTVDLREWERLIDILPGHCTSTISDAARACAQTWQEFADQMEGR